MNFIFCKLKKPQKTWISFFASLKNLKKYEFHFCKLKKTQKSRPKYSSFWGLRIYILKCYFNAPPRWQSEGRHNNSHFLLWWMITVTSLILFFFCFVKKLLVHCIGWTADEQVIKKATLSVMTWSYSPLKVRSNAMCNPPSTSASYPLLSILCIVALVAAFSSLTFAPSTKSSTSYL